MLKSRIDFFDFTFHLCLSILKDTYETRTVQKRIITKGEKAKKITRNENERRASVLNQVRQSFLPILNTECISIENQRIIVET